MDASGERNRLPSSSGNRPLSALAISSPQRSSAACCAGMLVLLRYTPRTPPRVALCRWSIDSVDRLFVVFLEPRERRAEASGSPPKRGLIRRGPGAAQGPFARRSACGRRPCSGWAVSRRSSRRSTATWRRGSRWSRSIAAEAWRGPSWAEYPGAIEDFTKALELHPDLGRAGVSGLDASGRATRPKLALRDFELAIELDPKNGDAYNGRGFGPRQPGVATARRVEDADGSSPPRAAVTAIALQRRADLRPVPRPLPAARVRADPAGFAARSPPTSAGLSGPRNIRTDAALAALRQPSVVRQTGHLSCPREK